MGLKIFFAIWLLAGTVITVKSVRLLTGDDPYTEKINAEFLACVPPMQGYRSLARLKFRYSYNGTEYEGKSILESGGRLRNYTRGHKYEIYINPDKPQNLIINKNDGAGSAVAGFVAGLLILLTGIVFLIAC